MNSKRVVMWLWISLATIVFFAITLLHPHFWSSWGIGEVLVKEIIFTFFSLVFMFVVCLMAAFVNWLRALEEENRIDTVIEESQKFFSNFDFLS